MLDKSDELILQFWQLEKPSGPSYCGFALKTGLWVNIKRIGSLWAEPTFLLRISGWRKEHWIKTVPPSHPEDPWAEQGCAPMEGAVKEQEAWPQPYLLPYRKFSVCWYCMYLLLSGNVSWGLVSSQSVWLRCSWPHLVLGVKLTWNFPRECFHGSSNQFRGKHVTKPQ